MFKSLIVLVIGVLASSNLFACPKNITCDHCAKESEFSWNPNNQYVTAQLNRFYSLNEKISSAYVANEFEQAKALAEENLELAAIYRCNWNYGNAIHNSNSVLGLISLKSGDVKEASDYLLKAGKSTGSPQLNTFGPKLDLANELLKIDQTEPVIIYLQEIKLFWEMNNGQVDAWLAEIEKGQKPELDRFVSGEPRYLQIAIFWLGALWPVLVSSAFLYKQKNKIARKPLFFILAVSSGYLLVFVSGWLINFGIQKLLPNLENFGNTTVLLVSILPILWVFLLPILVIYVWARFFTHTPNEISKTP